MRPNWVEHEASQYAKESYTNEDKKAAFVAGARWLAERFARSIDHGPMVEHLCSKGTKDYLDELSLKDIKKELSWLLSTVPAAQDGKDG